MAAPPLPATPSPAPSGKLVGGGSSATEGLRGLLCGVLFGLAAPLVGQPLDTLKTRMQASAAYYEGGALRTLVALVRAEGPRALYRGILPPLVGSSIFRSVQLSAYAAAYAAAAGAPALVRELPGAGGLQLRVLTSAFVASTARALIETPLELIKVRQQTRQPWLLRGASLPAQLRGLYSGFALTWARTCGLMGTFFIFVDTLERHAPELVAVPLLGPFLKGGVGATLGWAVVFPLETLKTQAQARAPGVPDGASALARARHVLRDRGGVRGLYRGIGPGLARSLIANGTSMVVYTACQQAMRARGGAA
jgi:solute carrier family 25 carnitine/acylcarnitine transporter 20/29